MKLNTSAESVRIELSSGEHFVDCEFVEGYEHYALMFRSLDAFNYWAVLKYDGYDPVRIVAFKNKEWFDEWYKSLEQKPVILLHKAEKKVVLASPSKNNDLLFKNLK
jgi:hypothetical protein